jgi:hypothetical protein
MFSVVTNEVRWFYAGLAPGMIIDWHHNLGGLFREHETRTDHYLILPGNDGLGIKWREGRIELKKKIADLGMVKIHSGIGMAEQWKKWSFEIEQGDQTFSILTSEPENWVAVTKKRCLQLFTFNQDDELIPHSGTFGEDETVRVELSEVKLNEKHWWTLGVEFTVQKNEAKSDSTVLMRRLLADFPDLKLDASASFGYPKWLADRLRT